MVSFTKSSRLSAEYECLDEQFKLSSQKYNRQQYSHLYYERLLQLRKHVKSHCHKLWPSVSVRNVLEVEEGVECVVIGTVYKNMQLKPSILQEYSKERSNVPLATPTKFVAENDFLVLEDEGGRMRLSGTAILPAVFVTGVVIAVKGREMPNGEFAVDEISVPNIPPQNEFKWLKNSEPGAPKKYVALISGLEIGRADSDPLLTQLLIDHLSGNLGGPEDEKLSASVVRAIIAGNSINVSSHQDSLSSHSLAPGVARALDGALKQFDMVVSQLAASMPLDILPGPLDPANFALPQQVLHPCLLPSSRLYNSLTRATNPHSCRIDGVLFLGTSGQNIDDLRRFTNIDDASSLLELTLTWRHMAPTAPDTLGCYPFVDRDPFILEECPHVYFCGNQPEFSTRLIRGDEGQVVRVVSIPSFTTTGEIVLVDIHTLDCHILSISHTS